MESKILLLKDKTDYVLKVTDDEIINVTGSVGSGKSTYGINHRHNKDFIVIDFDSIGSDNDPDTLTDDILELRKKLAKNHDDLTIDEIHFYDEIVSFIKSKNKKGIIVGGHLMHMKNISDFKGTIIVKRTARFKCFYRSAYRDFKNPAWRVGLTRWGVFKRFFRCFKRRFHHVFPQKQVPIFIDRLEKYNKLS